MEKRLVALPGFVRSKWLEVVQKNHGEVPGLVFVAKGFGILVANIWYCNYTHTHIYIYIHIFDSRGPVKLESSNVSENISPI